MKYLGDQIQLWFVFALATLNTYINFYIGNTVGILTADNLLHMPCLVFAFRFLMQL